MIVCFCGHLPAQQLWIGEDLLQSSIVADAEGEGGLSWVAGKMPGYACREGQDHLPCDLHNTPETRGYEAELRQKHTHAETQVTHLNSPQYKLHTDFSSAS